VRHVCAGLRESQAPFVCPAHSRTLHSSLREERASERAREREREREREGRRGREGEREGRKEREIARARTRDSKEGGCWRARNHFAHQDLSSLQIVWRRGAVSSRSNGSATRNLSACSRDLAPRTCTCVASLSGSYATAPPPPPPSPARLLLCTRDPSRDLSPREADVHWS
jgi:hypothetical protein